jgi:hypothetical protein
MKRKKWRVVMIVADTWNKECGWMSAEEIVRAVKASMDLPIGLEITGIGAERRN